MTRPATRPIQERDIIRISLESSQEILQLFEDYQHEKLELSRLNDAEFTKAQAEKENKLHLSPDDLSNYLSLATVYEMQDDLNKAINMLEKWQERYPNCPDVYVQLISLYERTGNYEKARDTYTRVPTPKYAICLRELPPSYDQFLVCGITSRTQRIDNFDEVVDPKDKKDKDFAGILRRESVIRLGFLSWIPKKDIKNVLGQISEERHKRLLEKLAEYITHP